MRKVAQRNLLKFLKHIGKDDEWGIVLMEYTWQHPNILGSVPRPIVQQAVRGGFQACNVNYEPMQQDYKADINTGRFVQ